MEGNSLWSYTYRTYWTPSSGVPGKAIHRGVAHQRLVSRHTCCRKENSFPLQRLSSALSRQSLTSCQLAKEKQDRKSHV